MKRVLSLFLAFVMILGLMPITALPARTVASTDAVGSEELVDAVGSYKRLETLMERGSVTYTYDLGYSTEFYNNYVRTAYDIKPGGAGRIAIEQLPATHETVYIQFFASDYTKISSVSYTEGAVVSIPEGCDFIRIEIRTTENVDTLALRFYDCLSQPKEAKRSGSTPTVAATSGIHYP